MSVGFGTGTSFTAELGGPFVNKDGGGGGKQVSVSLPVSGWKNAVSPFMQVVTVNGVSLNSKVDLQADVTQAEKLKRTALLAVNDSGTVTVYAIGDKPDSDLSLQAVLTDVVKSTTGGIYGGILGTLAPRGDFGEADPGEPDYIANKPTEKIEGALQKTGGTMTGAIHTKGLYIDPGDLYDSAPETVEPYRLIWVKAGG
jgi:hypothetical protein|nr:MAG TPA: hypothetical protein [Caudoviricetes sp.]